MNNVIVSIKRFLGNKNTVTILGVLAGIVVLYIGYNWRVKQAVEPVSIPYAKQEIAANTKITKEMIGTIKVSKSFVDTNPELVTASNKIIGKYVSYDTKIPEGSLFYSSELMEEQEMPNYITKDLEKCHTIYVLSVDLHSTYGNAIMPGDYIDLFITAKSDEGKVIVAKLIESIKVRDVRDNKGKSVFSSMSTTQVPAELVFSVPNDMFLLLTRADNVKTNSIKIFPVPRNQEYTENAAATQVASQDIIDLINSKSDLSYSVSTQIDLSCLSE